MRNKKHGILLLIFSALLLSDGEIQPGIFFATIGLFLIYKWWKNPRRLLEKEIQSDANLFNIKIPKSNSLNLAMLKIYSKYLRLRSQFPALKETYRDIIESMWKQLATLDSSNQWKIAVETVDKNWPAPIDMKEIMGQKIEKLKKETKQWENATLQASK